MASLPGTDSVELGIYSGLRATGIAGLGCIPQHWVIKQLGFVSWVRARLGWKGLKAEEYVEDGYVFLSTPNIKDRYVDFTNVNYISLERYEESPEIKLRRGDVLLAKDGSTLGTVNVVRDLPRPATVNSSIAVITPKAELNSVFLYYLFRSNYLEQVIQQAKGGMGVPHLFQSDLTKFRIPLPPITEQESIATFLDRETVKIDALVAEQRQLIELLKEKRQAVIAHTVTKGLNPNAPMKPSGIDWLGDVPAHWQVMPIRYVAKLESGHTPSRQRPEWWIDCTIPWFTLADVGQIRQGGTETIFETKELVSELGLQNSSARLLPKGTVMLSRTASVGFSAIMGVPMATTQDFANWICGPRLRPEYLLYSFRSMSGEFRRLMYGSTHNTIYMPDIQAFRFALPPLDEQDAIAMHIRSEAAGCDELIGAADSAMNLLLERRSALISAAVTGQIDVRQTGGLVTA